MLVEIQIKRSQIQKFDKLIRKKGCSIRIMEYNDMESGTMIVGGDDTKVLLNVYGNPADLFNLGRDMQKAPDSIIM